MKILFIAPEFPPNSSVGCVRPLNLCNYFATKNHSVTVITTEYNNESDFPIDLSTLETINENITVLRLQSLTYSKRFIIFLKSILGNKNNHLSILNNPINSNSKSRKIKYILTHLVDTIFGYIINFFNYSLDYPDHYNFFSNNLATKLTPDFYKGFDIVICTAPPFSHLKKIAFICNKYNIPCIADYRDLFFNDVLRPTGYFHRLRDLFYERKYIYKFNHIVCVSKSKRISMINNFEINEKFITVINNPFSKKFLGCNFSLNNENLLIFTYTGRLYRDRNLSRFFEFIKYLHEIPNFRKVQVNLAGSIEQSILTSILATFQNLYKFELNILGSLPRHKALELQENSDFLVLTLDQGTTSDGVIPAKVYEYLSSGKPTICFEVNKDVKDIFSETKAGLCSYSFSEQLNFLNDIIKSGFSPDISLINSFHIETIGDKYLKLLSETAFRSKTC